MLAAFAPADLASGVSALEAGRVEEAIRILAEIAEHDAVACYYLARALHVTGRYEEARVRFEQLLSSPANRTVKIYRAAALNFVALGQMQEAERHFLLAGEIFRAGNEDPRVDYGAFLVRQGRASHAIAPLEKAAAASPKSARPNVELGKALLHLGRPQPAALRLEKAVALDPQNWAARLLLGKAYLQLGRTADGERQIMLGQEGWSKQPQNRKPE